MTSEDSQDTPLGVLLISTFWIFVGVWFFTLMSSYGYYNAVASLFFTLTGTFFIILGWGLIILNKWAYYAALVMSVLGLFSMFYGVSGFIYILIGSYSSSGVIFLATFLFIPMTWYLSKNGKIFGEESFLMGSSSEIESPRRICPDCDKPIPFDANICPYCSKKFKDYL